MRMSEKCRNNKHNNNPDNHLTSRRIDDGGKKGTYFFALENDSAYIVSFLVVKEIRPLHV